MTAKSDAGADPGDRNAGLDLHIHSSASDGEFSAEEIARIVDARGLRLVAIADHDEGRASVALARLRPDVAVAAIELTCAGFGGYADLLGIGLRKPEALAGYWTFADINAVRLRSWIGRLTSLGWELPDVEVGGETRASWIISKRVYASPENRHRAATLGFHTESDFRAGMLSKGKPAHIEEEILETAIPVEEGIAAVTAAGGVPVLAHPGLGPLLHPAFEQGLGDLVAAGLEGLEAVHPAQAASTEARLASLAARFGILIGVGSDTHDGEGGIGSIPSSSGLDLDAILASWIDRLGRPT